jgi:hypothetical protein
MSGILNPGTFILCNKSITNALSAEVQTGVDGLEGIAAATLRAQFAYGSGGTTAKAWVQTSLDGGNSWQDVACFAFTTSSAVKEFNLSGLTPVTTAYTPVDGAMADDTCKDGILGPLWRVKLTTTGVYAGPTNLLVSLEAR